MSIVDKLASRAQIRMSEYYNSYTVNDQDVKTVQSYLEDVYRMLQSDSTYTEGVKYLCEICEHAPDDDFCKTLLVQCINSSRIFLYEDMLISRGVIDVQDADLYSTIQKAFYSLPNDLILTKEQKDLFDLFSEKKKLVISAPTSFGKSRIIREIIIHNNYQNIVLIVPTNALLNETYTSFLKDSRFKNYNLIFSTHIPPSEGKDIYIFTPEKFDLYSDEHSLNYDFFVFDEVYKVSDRDSRSSVYANCLYKAYIKQVDYYLIGPYFKRFSENYLNKTGGFFEHYKTDIVQKAVYDYPADVQVEIESHILPPRRGKETRLKEVVKNIDGQSIIYVSRKLTAESKAKLLKPLYEEVDSQEVEDLVEYISETISEQWSLISCLQKGIAFHHAGIPKHIQTEIVDLFNNGTLHNIVCTPTLTEGVNTTAKNVIFFDNTKANIPLSGFEVKNIIGRSGRFGHHFIGRAIFLDKKLPQIDMDKIEYPLFDSPTISKEDNLHVEYDDLTDYGKAQRREIIREARENSVPLSLLRGNKYIKFENQLNLISYLREQPHLKDHLFFKTNMPKKEQLGTLIEIIHEILFSESDKNQNWTTGKLQKFCKFQVYRQPSIKELVHEYNAVGEDTKIRNILTLIYQYFEFKLPKYLIAFEKIFNFVYNADFSTAPLIIQLQYGSNKIQDILLTDAGVPSSIIKKISKQLDGLDNIYDIKAKILSAPTILQQLSSVETKMLLKRI